MSVNMYNESYVSGRELPLPNFLRLSQRTLVNVITDLKNDRCGSLIFRWKWHLRRECNGVCGLGTRCKHVQPSLLDELRVINIALIQLFKADI